MLNASKDSSTTLSIIAALNQWLSPYKIHSVLCNCCCCCCCNRRDTLMCQDGLQTRKLCQSPIPHNHTTMNWGCLSKSLHLISERDISGLRTHSFHREWWLHGHIFESFLAQKHSPSRGFESPPFNSIGECHNH